jgi:hypothetical protein
MPEVDFQKQMVVGVFHGRSCNCDGIKLLHAIDCKDSVELFLRGAYYQTGMVADEVTAYGIYVLPRIRKKVLVKEDMQNLIGGPPVWKIVGELKVRKTARDE